MANITVLHWNIETLSNEKLDDGNGQALVDYIARVVIRSGANIVSLVEVKNSAAARFSADLIAAINVANGVAVNQWHGLSIDSLKNSEAYVIIWQLGHNFVPLTPVGGVNAINGLTNQTLVAGIPGGVLRFNGALTKSGGRKPCFVAFKATDGGDRPFTVVSYHAMFGSNLSSVGVTSIGRLAQSRAIVNTGNIVNLDASLTCGDFNVYFDPNVIGGAYDNLMNVVPSAWSTTERTSLLNNSPIGGNGYPTSVQYRVNAYDNIFRYAQAGLPAVGGGTVLDLINDSTRPPPLGVGSGLMVNRITPFLRAPITNGAAIQNIPPRDFEDSWHIVRHAISNHLPVYVSMVI